MRVDRDFVFLLNAYDIEPGSYHAQGQHHAGLQSVDLEQPRVPGIDPLVCRTGDRVRIRSGNLTMTNHPMHARPSISR
jgi:FtsP/CotA-like multicopper oxidase with cupredoxin domain